ncbi:hypothetical protein [Dokdonella immobilis]|uniref:Uncharacterized protein n=1 Tax=Dokdonella immobilis TaxID=578942 RepID=A0A1I4XIS9_9GAMM|nr:hypothetical protein [Dokdonella immobilis]SFN25734.1 hypothetical protein SAMN05216289_11048 [Dokdonella immobilis]
MSAPTASAANPFVAWKDRLFGARPVHSPVRESNPEGVVVLGVDRPEHLRILGDSDQREFPQGKSRFRELELQREFEHVALRVQVIARSNPHGRGNAVFKPVIYLLDDRGEVRESKAVEPLYLDIRPFRPTRLLACVPLEKVRRFAVATPASALGTSYESKSRDKVSAKSKGGFYYATDPIKVNLPYVETGELIVEVVRANRKGEGC